MAESTALPGLLQKLSAEAIGTFVLVLLGCGSIVYASNTSAPSTTTTVGLTFGIALMVMVYAFGRVSGGHFNPAVSVGAAIGGRVPWRDAGAYVLAQVVGAVLGALALFLLMHGFDGYDATDNMGQNFFGDHGGSQYAWWAAFLLEAVVTAVLVVVVLAVSDERFEHPAVAPLAIGLTFAAIYFVAFPATGASANPARSIGPALFAGGDHIVQLWLFILAPLVGAAVAGFGYPALFGRGGAMVPGSGLTFGWPRARAAAGGTDQYQQQWNQESTTGYAAQEPIIQDGWQWDPVGQQWHPVGQTPEQWRAQQAASQQSAPEAAPVAEPGPVAEDPGDQTRIRPPQ